MNDILQEYNKANNYIFIERIDNIELHFNLHTKQTLLKIYEKKIDIISLFKEKTNNKYKFRCSISSYKYIILDLKIDTHQDCVYMHSKYNDDEYSFDILYLYTFNCIIVEKENHYEIFYYFKSSSEIKFISTFNVFFINEINNRLKNNISNI